MTTENLGHVLRHLRRLGEADAAHDLSDGELLERFRSRQEETAFALLVERHGPLVLGVCRRLLGNVHEAEDAFQAVFLVLVRRAGSVRKGEALASWLYGVAYRVATKARARRARRRTAEALAVTEKTPSEPRDELSWDELRDVLDEEIARLPDKYREPVLLCYLEGKTHQEAAHTLKWPKSSVSARLERARQLLHERLSRRGVTLSLASLTAALSGTAASAAVPARLTLTTVRMAVLTAAGKTATVAPPVVALADGVVRGMSQTKLALLTGVLMAAGFLAAGVGVRARMSETATPVGRNPATRALRIEPVHAAEPQATAPPARRVPARAGEKSGKVDVYGDPLPSGAVARLGTVRLRHGDSVRAAACTADGRTIATAGQDGTVRVWDVASGKEVHRVWDIARGKEVQPLTAAADFADKRQDILSGTWPPDTFCALAFTADGQALIGRGAQEIVIWNTATWKVSRRLPVAPSAFVFATPLVLSPNDQVLATSCQGNLIRLWEVATGKELQTLEGHRDAILGLVFSPDGQRVASASKDRSVRLWDVATGKELRQFDGHEGRVWNVAFAPDGKTLISAGEDSSRLWDVASGKPIRTFDGRRGGGAVAFTPDGKLLLWDRILDPATGETLRTFEESFFHCRLSHNGQTVVSWDNGSSVPRLWDATTGKEKLPVSGPHRPSWALAFAPDGKDVVTGSWFERQTRVWDAGTGKERRRWVGEGTSVFAFSPDGKTLAASTGIEKATIHLWERAGGKEVLAFATGQGITQAMCFSPDGRSLATADDRSPSVCLWDAATGKPLRTFTGPTDGKALVFSADSNVLTLAGADPRQAVHTLVAWDVETGKELRRVTRRGRVASKFAFSPDARLVAFAAVELGQVALRVLAAENGAEVLRVPFDAARCDCLAFSPDGRLLAFTANNVQGPIDTGHGKSLGFTPDCEVRLIETATGKERDCFVGFQGTAVSLAFAPDGNRLASASHDTTVLLWDLTGGLSGKALTPKNGLEKSASPAGHAQGTGP